MRWNTNKTGAAALAYLAFFIYEVSTGLLGTMLSALLADFGLGLIVCRFACSALSARLQPQSILRAGLLAAAVLFSGGLLAGGLWPAVCGGAAAGLFAGATIPLCITIGYGDHPHTQGTVSMLLFLSICAGQIIVPWGMGLIAEHWSLTAAMWCNAAVLGGTALSAVMLRRGAAE